MVDIKFLQIGPKMQSIMIHTHTHTHTHTHIYTPPLFQSALTLKKSAAGEVEALHVFTPQ